MIDSVDNFDRALSTTPAEALAEGGDKDLKALHDGLRMTESILLQTLKKHGLERFDPSEQGDKFDPNRHEATFQVPQPDKQDGTCFHTQQKGFVLNGRVLRVSQSHQQHSTFPSFRRLTFALSKTRPGCQSRRREKRLGMQVTTRLRTLQRKPRANLDRVLIVAEYTSPLQEHSSAQ